MKPSLWAAFSLAVLLAGAGCGDVSVDKLDGAYSTCEDLGGQYYFRVQIPPWKYNKEYRCSDYQGGRCVGTWSPTGRYVFVVSDVPFVNFDSEIITSLDVEITTGDTATLASQLIASESIGVTGSVSVFFGAAEDYPRAIEATEEGGLPGHEVLWRQERTFQGNVYNWYRRDVFLQGTAGRRYHLRFFSIERMDRPEFEVLIGSFREGPSPDGAPDCTCQDEHDPSGAQDC